MLVAYGYSEARADSTANSKQDSLKAQALASTDVQQRASLVSQINTQHQTAVSASSHSNASYALGAAVLALAWWLNHGEPVAPQEPTSKVEISLRPMGTQGGLTPAIAWRW